jgi:hypothetical protein
VDEGDRLVAMAQVEAEAVEKAEGAETGPPAAPDETPPVEPLDGGDASA